MNAIKTLVLAFGLIRLADPSDTSSFAATYTISAGADARILSLGGYAKSNFKDDILSVYTVADNVQRTLLRFDLSSLVLGPFERIESATLTLFAETGFGNSGGKPMDIYRVLVPWDEATVTWLNRNSQSPWSKPGADFEAHGPQPFSSLVATPQNGAAVTWNITELVDYWAENIIPNHGLILLSSEGNGLTFTPDEDPLPGRRPFLTVTTGDGPPRIRAEIAQNGGVLLSWRGIGIAALEEASAPGPLAAWSTSALPIIELNGYSRVAVPHTGSARYFRLRAPAP